MKSLKQPGLITPENSQDIRARVVVLAPGEEMHEHNSDDHEEVLLFLDGDAVLTMDGKDFDVPKGNAVFIPKNTLHAIRNKTKKQLKYAYVRSLE